MDHEDVSDGTDKCTGDERDVCCNQPDHRSPDDQQEICNYVGCNLKKCAKRYDDDEEEEKEEAVDTYSLPNFADGSNGLDDHFKKVVSEDCEVKYPDSDNANVCVKICTTLTKIFDGDDLLDEHVKTTQSSCGGGDDGEGLNKKQMRKQNQD